MVIHAIQEDDANGGLLECPCCRQADESSPHDHDMRLCPLRLGFECFVHYISPVSLSPDRRAPRDPPGVGQPRPKRWGRSPSLQGASSTVVSRGFPIPPCSAPVVRATARRSGS